LGLYPKYRQVGSWVSAYQRGDDRLSIGQANLKVIVSLDDVMRGYNESICRPDDPTGRQPPPRLNPDDTGRGYGHGLGQSIRQIL
jgi:hypothetical protein